MISSVKTKELVQRVVNGSYHLHRYSVKGSVFYCLCNKTHHRFKVHRSVIYTLARKGYIDLPKRDGEIFFKKYSLL